MTYEFRTPLTVISGMAEQMEGDAEGKTLIKRNSGQLLSLVNQMLDLRKLESGKMSVQKIQSDIVKYLRYLTESLKSYAELQGLKIHFLAEKPELTMDFDPGKMTRIRANLLSNAINEPPGVYLIRVESEGGAVAIRRMVVVR
ncbi:MAG: HAMP domain-containing histidine kinase [Lewinella sp.]|nr:HAMP domain-containing histidine kinase [Lewinella sp.]